MLKRPLPRALAWAVLSCLFLSACTLVNRSPTEQAPIESPKYTAAGDYEKTLDSLREAHKKNPRDKELTANYVRTVKEIKGAADRALSQQDYARAGSIYRILLDRYDDFGAFEAKLKFKKVQLETALKNCRTALVDNPVQQALKAGNFARALEIYQAALRENPGDAELAAKYRTTLNDIKAAGDKAFASKDFAQAGRVNVLLLKNFPSFEGLRPPVAFSRGILSEAIAVCRDGLTKKGLQEYRKGDLAKAIAVWEGLLSFDPDNAEIKKAVNTARTQLNEIIKKK
jgi:tetratricopeptide (TPR) repeat protein